MPTRRAATSKMNPLGLTPGRLALIDEAGDQELANANEAGSVASDRFVRTNGGFTAQMIASDPCIRLPYGSIARLLYSVKKPTQIPWEYLKAQMGSRYADDAQGLRDFRKAFVEALSAVKLFYSEANVTPLDGACPAVRRRRMCYPSRAETVLETSFDDAICPSTTP